VSRAALSAADHVAYLPMLGRVGSLNVATAAAIAMYELRRRSWT
jgi:tRNA (guanosine-2'-O-)-methyltransferase